MMMAIRLVKMKEKGAGSEGRRERCHLRSELDFFFGGFSNWSSSSSSAAAARGKGIPSRLRCRRKGDMCLTGKKWREKELQKRERMR